MDKIRLTNTTSVQSENKGVFLDVKLEGTSKDLKYNNIRKVIDTYEVYKDERSKCERYRLIVTVNPFCTNVLFNPLTEIVKYIPTNNGGVRIERVVDSSTVNGIDGNNTSKRVQYIANTTYSNKDYGYIYYPGYDIFDNHILRAKDFCVITDTATNNSSSLSVFNTLADYARDDNGEIIKMVKRSNGAISRPNEVKKHVYNYETLMSYEDSVNNNISEQDGWFGFPNTTKLVTYNKKDKKSNWCRVLNNHSSSEFIQMYPGRDLFSFSPIYNEILNRLEYNWDILITYPFRNEYQLDLVSFCQGVNALKMYSGTKQVGLSGENIMMFRSCTKHNLARNDNVRILWRFKKKEIISGGQTGMSHSEIKTEYYGFENVYRVANVGNLNNENEEYYFYIDDRSLLENIENSINGKKNANNGPITISDIMFYIQKIKNGLPSKYYLRKFKKIEHKYINQEYKESQKQLSKEQYNLGFATTIYNDGVTQITFNDEIDLHGLKDNLGRPVREFFITFLKTNRGNTIWYQDTKDNNKYIDLSSNIVGEDAKQIEASHCFTKLTDGLELHCENNDIFNDEDSEYIQRSLHNIRYIGGDDHEWLSKKTTADGGDYNKTGITINDDEFYGDVVEFIQNEYKEYILSDVNYRFNTYQRENPIGDLVYHDILSDDYDFNREFEIHATPATQESRDEGYFYKPHYSVRVREDGGLEQGGHYTIRIRNVEVVQYDDVFLRIVSLQGARVNEGDVILLMDDKNGYIFKFKVTYVSSSYVFFVIPVNGWFGNGGLLEESADKYETPLTWSDIAEHLRRGKDLFLRRYNEDIPSYAIQVGRNIFLWRKVYNSGELDNSALPDYTFANNALYITPTINFFLKRQDPNGYYSLYRIEKQNPQDIAGETKKQSNYEYKDTEITATC